MLFVICLSLRMCGPILLGLFLLAVYWVMESVRKALVGRFGACRSPAPSASTGISCSLTFESRCGNARSSVRYSSAAEIAHLLQTQGSSLNSLDLRSNRLTDKCAKAIAASLADNSVLSHLNL
jgi:hypothetical protein